MSSFPDYSKVNNNQNGYELLASNVTNIQKQQDFMDQFLSMVWPEYSHLKNFVFETQRQRAGPPPANSNCPFPCQIVLQHRQQQQGASPPHVPIPIVVYLPQTQPEQKKEVELQHQCEATPPATTTPGTNCNVEDHHNCCEAAAAAAASGAGPGLKMRKKKATLQEVASTILKKSPKRRGRKRKFPLVTPVAVPATITSNEENSRSSASSPGPDSEQNISRRQIEASPMLSSASAVEENNATVTVPITTGYTGTGSEDQEMNMPNGQPMSSQQDQDIQNQSIMGQNDQYTTEKLFASPTKDTQPQPPSEHYASASPSPPENEMTCLDLLATVSSSIRAQTEDGSKDEKDTQKSYQDFSYVPFYYVEDGQRQVSYVPMPYRVGDSFGWNFEQLRVVPNQITHQNDKPSGSLSSSDGRGQGQDEQRSPKFNGNVGQHQPQDDKIPEAVRNQGQGQDEIKEGNGSGKRYKDDNEDIQLIELLRNSVGFTGTDSKKRREALPVAHQGLRNQPRILRNTGSSMESSERPFGNERIFQSGSQISNSAPKS